MPDEQDNFIDELDKIARLNVVNRTKQMGRNMAESGRAFKDSPLQFTKDKGDKLWGATTMRDYRELRKMPGVTREQLRVARNEGVKNAGKVAGAVIGPDIALVGGGAMAANMRNNRLADDELQGDDELGKEASIAGMAKGVGKAGKGLFNNLTRRNIRAADKAGSGGMAARAKHVGTLAGTGTAVTGGAAAYGAHNAIQDQNNNQEEGVQDMNQFNQQASNRFMPEMNKEARVFSGLAGAVPDVGQAAAREGGRFQAMAGNANNAVRGYAGQAGEYAGQAGRAVQGQVSRANQAVRNAGTNYKRNLTGQGTRAGLEGTPAYNEARRAEMIARGGTGAVGTAALGGAGYAGYQAMQGDEEEQTASDYSAYIEKLANSEEYAQLAAEADAMAQEYAAMAEEAAAEEEAMAQEGQEMPVEGEEEVQDYGAMAEEAAQLATEYAALAEQQEAEMAGQVPEEEMYEEEMVEEEPQRGGAGSVSNAPAGMDQSASEYFMNDLEKIAAGRTQAATKAMRGYAGQAGEYAGQAGRAVKGYAGQAGEYAGQAGRAVKGYAGQAGEYAGQAGRNVKGYAGQANQKARAAGTQYKQNLTGAKTRVARNTPEWKAARRPELITQGATGAVGAAALGGAGYAGHQALQGGEEEQVASEYFMNDLEKIAAGRMANAQNAVRRFGGGVAQKGRNVGHAIGDTATNYGRNISGRNVADATARQSAVQGAPNSAIAREMAQNLSNAQRNRMIAVGGTGAAGAGAAGGAGYAGYQAMQGDEEQLASEELMNDLEKIAAGRVSGAMQGAKKMLGQGKTKATQYGNTAKAKATEYGGKAKKSLGTPTGKSVAAGGAMAGVGGAGALGYKAMQGNDEEKTASADYEESMNGLFKEAADHIMEMNIPSVQKHTDPMDRIKF